MLKCLLAHNLIIAQSCSSTNNPQTMASFWGQSEHKVSRSYQLLLLRFVRWHSSDLRAREKPQFYSEWTQVDIIIINFPLVINFKCHSHWLPDRWGFLRTSEHLDMSACVFLYKSVCHRLKQEAMCVTEGQELEDQSVTSLQSAARQPYLCVCVCACVRERDMRLGRGGRECKGALGDTWHLLTNLQESEGFEFSLGEEKPAHSSPPSPVQWINYCLTTAGTAASDTQLCWE